MDNLIEPSQTRSKLSDSKIIISSAVRIKYAVINPAFNAKMALLCAGADRSRITMEMIDEFNFDFRLYNEDQDAHKLNNDDSIVQRCSKINANAIFWPNLEMGKGLYDGICMGRKLTSLLRLTGASEEKCKGGKYHIHYHISNKAITHTFFSRLCIV